MGYRFLSHTADTGVEAWAPTREELFAEALTAFTDTVTDVGRVRPQLVRELEVAAPGLPDLMVEWLEELLYRFETEGILFAAAEVTVTADEEEDLLTLTARARGEEYDPGRQPLKILVKAVTYHHLEVGEGADGSWRARVIFDI